MIFLSMLIFNLFNQSIFHKYQLLLVFQVATQNTIKFGFFKTNFYNFVNSEQETKEEKNAGGENLFVAI